MYMMNNYLISTITVNSDSLEQTLFTLRNNFLEQLNKIVVV